MPRSVRVQPEFIEKVKLAVRRNGFHSQRALAEAIGLSLSTVSNFLTGKPVDYATSVEICQRLGFECLEVTELNDVPSCLPKVQVEKAAISNRQDWEETIDVSRFYGRREELDTLKQWIVNNGYCLVIVIGKPGSGKTALCMKLAESIQDEFDWLIWRSLRQAPPLQELVVDLIRFLAQQQEIKLEAIDEAIETLLRYLRASRCLIILDGAESIWDRDDVNARQEGKVEEYKRLLVQVEQSACQSCLVLTSRENLPGLNLKVGEGLLILKSQTKIKYEFVLSGSVDEASRQKLEAIVAHLQTITGDSSLTLVRVEPGSIKLILEGSEDGFHQLEDLLRKGQLVEVEGLTVESVTTTTSAVQPDRNFILKEAEKYGLTDRETEVWLLRQLEECTYQEMASRLCVSVETIKRHMKKIYAKRNVATDQAAKAPEQTGDEMLQVTFDER